MEMDACLFFSLHKAGLGVREHLHMFRGIPNMPGCEATEEATAPVFCVLLLAEEEKGGAGTLEVVVGQRLCFLIPL